MSKEKKKKSDIVLDILLVLCILVVLGTGGYLGVYFYNIYKSQSEFDDLKTLIDDSSNNEDGDSYEEVELEDGTVKKVSTRLIALYHRNNDFIGWLTIEGTKIDYPVMYTPNDPEYYIHRNFNKEYSYGGTLFVDAACSPLEVTTTNIIIYGHHMKAGTMFNNLTKYDSEDYYKEHKYITFDTLDGDATYEIIAAFRTKIYDDDDTEHFDVYKFVNTTSEEEFDEFVSNAKASTPYETDATAEYGDQLITLSTCAYHTTNGRFVVIAKKLSEEE